MGGTIGKCLSAGLKAGWMPRNREHRLEYPSGLGYSRTGPSIRETGLLFESKPETEIEALMSAAPHQEPEPVNEQYGDLFAIAEEILTDDELAVIQMLYGGRLSQRETGLMLARQNSRGTAYSKTWVRKLRNRALAKLKEHCARRYNS